jgi:aconitate hydratase
MGQAPATNQISLRTTPRNFPGRSGTKEDKVYLCSPETATASAITGVITDPRDLKMKYPHYEEPEKMVLVSDLIPPVEGGHKTEVIKGPNIKSLPEFGPLPDAFEAPVILKVGDNISTDEISPAGAAVLPYRSNIPKISEFTYYKLDETFHKRALKHQKTGSLIVAGKNYGQGSSREHAAIAPRYLGIRAVVAKSYARIHRKNLINFGVIPLTFKDPSDYDKISLNDELDLKGIHKGLASKEPFKLFNKTKNETYEIEHEFSPIELESLMVGSLIEVIKRKNKLV